MEFVILGVLILLGIVFVWYANTPQGQAQAAKAVAAEQSRFSAELSRLTSSWQKPVVVRTYDTTKKDGTTHFEREAEVLLEHGYHIEGQTSDGGHIHAGRLLLTGGLSVLAGKKGIRSGSKLSVTFLR